MSAKKTNKKPKKETEKNKTKNKENIKLQEENKKLKQELEEKNDKLLRSLADIQNLQKRTQKEFLSTEIKTKQKYVSELIDLKELLEKALDDENPKEGLKSILKNIENFLEKENIECIDCVGKKFDHNLHHAVTTLDKKDCCDGEIIDEIKKGFKIGDVVLRPSHVVVAKNDNEKN